MSGLLDGEALTRVISAWRRCLRLDPLLSRIAMPDLQPFAIAFNNALTGEDDGQLIESCNSLVRSKLEPATVVRVTTLLAETFTDEANTNSGAVRKSLVSTLGHVCGLLMTTMVADVSELARRDSLTGLENRRAWDEALSEKIASPEDFSLAMIDLDGLKAINDGQGHEAGDNHLKKFAVALRKGIIESGQVFRFAGDEYAVLVSCGGSNLQAQLEDLSRADAVAAFSFGVADTISDGRNLEQLVKAADDRMYSMKKAHKELIGASSSTPADFVSTTQPATA
jgi:diguanylate cyclase (GGDEF)-like protein